MKLIQMTTILAAALVVASLVPNIANADPINKRLNNQHRRIVQGIRSGHLTRKEAAVVRSDDRYIHSQERFDRSTHRGHLTKRERVSLQRQLNKNSRRIYKLKHNGINR